MSLQHLLESGSGRLQPGLGGGRAAVSVIGPRIFWLENAIVCGVLGRAAVVSRGEEREKQSRGVLSPQPLSPLLCLPFGDLHSCVLFVY